ncbi:MAG: N-acetyl-gamma-glutamyl-phosphate reductase [Eubacteriaceae bacterium]|nr:N-acetyl-gamma-glutamyl-phosphate reductase [Eubacteriaceae bacterium]
MKLKVGVIGATGYAGAELVRLLLMHPYAKMSAISSVSYKGQSLSQIYPGMTDLCDDILNDEQYVLDNSDVVFASLPHGLSEEIALKCYENNKLFIDLGADFRLFDEEEYKLWYGSEYKQKKLHKNAVYSIPELNRNELKGAKIIANPGCYPTSASLAIVPALKAGIIDYSNIIIDSKSGVSGAGRGLTLETHFPECNEAFAPYKTATHRHTPEIEQTLSKYADKKVVITFVPHLLPINRGILTTAYTSLVNNIKIEEIIGLYKDFYANEKFVRIMNNGQTANVKYVRYSNYCNISLHKDERTGRLIIISAIDNMVKGAAGQAIQNMNIAMNIEQDAGLCYIPPSI